MPPIYEFCCHDCQKDFELQLKFSEPMPEKCPHCHSPSVQKKLSRTAFVLKGQGWYQTDFKAPAGGKTVEKKSEEASLSSTESATSSKEDVATPAVKDPSN